MSESFSVGELGMQAARGDALRVVVRRDSSYSEIVGTVTGHSESGRSPRLTVWVEVGSVRSWAADRGPWSASRAEWYYSDVSRWGEVGVTSGEPSKYQVHIDSAEFGATHSVPLGFIEELETGSMVSHSVPRSKPTPRGQATLSDFRGGVGDD
jgi:hypothetical protein